MAPTPTASPTGSVAPDTAEIRSLLDPVAIARETLAAPSPESAWRRFDTRLRRCGLERNALFTVPLGKGGFPDPEARFGVAISPEYEAFCYANPELAASVPGIRRLVAGDFIVPVIEDYDYFDRFSAEELAFYRTMHGFGYRGGFIASFPHRQDGSIAIFSSCSLVSADAARKAYKAAGALTAVATAFFLEALEAMELRDDPASLDLSPRERECLYWVAAGRTTGEIAARLGVTARTVDEFIGKATRKLRANKRTQACTRLLLLSLQES